MRRRIGHGGLIGAAARTAVVAGTATAVSGAVSGAMHKGVAGYPHPEAAPPQPAPPPAAAAPPPAIPAPPAPDTIAQLKTLAELHSSGALTDEEFAAQKAKVLAG